MRTDEWQYASVACVHGVLTCFGCRLLLVDSLLGGCGGRVVAGQPLHAQGCLEAKLSWSSGRCVLAERVPSSKVMGMGSKVLRMFLSRNPQFNLNYMFALAGVLRCAVLRHFATQQVCCCCFRDWPCCSYGVVQSLKPNLWGC